MAARTRITFSVVSNLLMAAMLLPLLSEAQTPYQQTHATRPIRLIVPYPASGGTDIVARAVSALMAEKLGQTIVVDNRPGAGSIIGVDLAAKSLPDAHTLLFVNLAFAINASLVAKLPYDSLKDLYPVSLIDTQPHVLLVHPSLPVKSTLELISLARSKPNQITYASSGFGTGPHLATELFSMLSGIHLQHIPYKGAAPALFDVMGAHALMTFSTIVTAMPYLQSGRLKVLGVTSAKRTPQLPNIPTIAESAIDHFEAIGWHLFLIRAGTPPPLIKRLQSAAVSALKDPSLKERLLSDGADIAGTGSEEAMSFLKTEISRWAKVIQASGIKPQ